MKLYPHQKQVLEAVKDKDHCAFYLDMGLGKTFVGSEKMMDLNASMNLVICQKSKVRDWFNHFCENYSGSEFCFLNLCNQKELEYFLEETPELNKIGIINYDLAWRRRKLCNLKDFTLLLDESSMIQNETAKRSKFILKMHPRNVILLSGTPTGGKYEKLWSQMKLLGWNISKTLYWKQFVIVNHLDLMDGRSIPIVAGYRNIPRLKQKMKEYGCQFVKSSEVFDLPQQNFQMIKVDQSKHYEQFRKTQITEVEGTTLVGDTTLKKMLYERQLCSMYSKEKLNAFNDLLDSTDERLIVFYNFTAELNTLKHACEAKNKPYSIVNGAIKDLHSYDEKNDSVTFLQYMAGAMGLNLQKANKVIYYSLPLSSELYEQSKKRIHRIGQNKPCFYYLLICRGSVEEKILRTLKQRQNYTAELFRKEDDHE